MSVALARASRGTRDCFQCYYGPCPHMSAEFEAVHPFRLSRRAQQGSKRPPEGNCYFQQCPTMCCRHPAGSSISHAPPFCSRPNQQLAGPRLRQAQFKAPKERERRPGSLHKKTIPFPVPPGACLAITSKRRRKHGEIKPRAGMNHRVRLKVRGEYWQNRLYLPRPARAGRGPGRGVLASYPRASHSNPMKLTLAFGRTLNQPQSCESFPEIRRSLRESQSASPAQAGRLCRLSP